MRPISRIILNNCHHQRGARRVGELHVIGIAQNGAMGRHDGNTEKTLDVRQFGLCLFLIQSGNGLQRQVRGQFTCRVAPHAVCQQKQPRAVGIAIPHAVFVFLPTTLATDLKDGKLHFGLIPGVAVVALPRRVSPTMLSNCMRTFSVTLSLV